MLKDRKIDFHSSLSYAPLTWQVVIIEIIGLLPLGSLDAIFIYILLHILKLIRTLLALLIDICNRHTLSNLWYIVALAWDVRHDNNEFLFFRVWLTPVQTGFPTIPLPIF